MYIKALEQEVLRLKETYGDICRERDALAEETRKLREILAANGLAHLLDAIVPDVGREPSSSGSISGSYAAASSAASRSSPPPMYGRLGSPSHGNADNNGGTNNNGQRSTAPIDYDGVGIDFVLAYGRSPYLSSPHDQ